jgi:hypothetical protein
MPESTTSPSFWFLGFWVSGCLGVWGSGFLGFWVSGFLGFWFSEFLGFWVSGCLGSRVFLGFSVSGRAPSVDAWKAEGLAWSAKYRARQQHVMARMNHHIHPVPNAESGGAGARGWGADYLARKTVPNRLGVLRRGAVGCYAHDDRCGGLRVKVWA